MVGLLSIKEWVPSRYLGHLNYRRHFAIIIDLNEIERALENASRMVCTSFADRMRMVGVLRQ